MHRSHFRTIQSHNFDRMSIDAGPASTASPRSLESQGRLFHTGMAVALLLTAVAGFGPTYFFKPIHPSPPLPPLLHVHGMVFTAWLVLLIVQSGLVRAERADLHKRLGLFGAALAVGVVILGFLVAREAARRGTSADGMSPLAFMIFPL